MEKNGNEQKKLEKTRIKKNAKEQKRIYKERIENEMKVQLENAKKSLYELEV